MKTFNHNLVELPKMVRTVDEDTGSRYYITPSGNRYQSVTSLTGNWNKKSINEWRKRVGEEKANEISQAAVTRGNRLHKVIENYLLNEPIDFGPSPETKSLFYKIKSKVDNLDNIRTIEGTMYSDSLQLAGTTDCIAEYEGKLAVVDFKTSTKAKKAEYIQNYFMQGGAYGKMFEERYGEKPENIVILLVSPAVEYPIVFIEPYEKCHKLLTDFMKTLAPRLIK